MKIDIGHGDMLLIDEAGMAGTHILDDVRAIADETGAVIRMLGDHRQLAAVEAGGALRLIYHDKGGIELAEVHRFTRPDEAEAVLQFRVGDERALQFYATNNRLFGGVQTAALDALYRDWQCDRAASRTSIMISDSNDVVRELSARAQTERRAAGLVQHQGITLHDRNVAGIGDLVVTRRNKRRLAVLAGKDYVKNGDLWQVESHIQGGGLRVRHLRHGGAVTLPAWYVERYLELGYASTIHRAQGMTVEFSRAFLSPSATREAALVALSRGTHGNHAYLDTEQLLDTDEPHLLPGDLFYRNRETTEALAALRAILRTEGAEPSATEELRDALETPYTLSNLVPQFSYGLHIHRGPAAVIQAEKWVRAGLPDYAEAILTDEAWPALQQVLHEAHDAGADPKELLSRRAMQRELDTAVSVAKVLHYRVTAKMPTRPPDPDLPELLPGWVPSPPGDTAFPEFGQLPEYTRETTAAQPPPAHPEYGGPGPAQLLLDLADNTNIGDSTVVVDDNQVGLFTTPTASAAATAPASSEPAELGGPDPAQLLLFHPTRPEPTSDADRADPAQFALFSADAPHHQADLIELGQWLNNRAGLIADRVQVLGERAAEDPPAWAAPLGDVPDDPITRQQWIAGAGHVAAYRERWDLPADVAEMLPPHDRGEQGRARNWVEIYLSENLQPPPRNPATHRPGTAGTTSPDAPAARDAGEQWKAQQQARAERRTEQQRQHHEQQTHDQRRKDAAARLLREVWWHEPDLVETIINAAAFPALARNLTAAADAGYNLHDILADIPLATVTWSTINDPAAFTARAVDRAVEHLRGGTPTAAQRAATQREKRTQLEQLREQATDLLRDTWSTRPELVTAVTHAPAFDKLATAIGRYGDAGLDLRKLLARLPVLRIDRDDVRDKAAYTTYALHRIADQQLRASDAEHNRAAAHTERHAALRGAAAVLRQAWSDDPIGANRVIDGPVFDILADRMATAADNGHDVHAVLARLDPAVLTAATAPPGATIIAFGRAIAAEPHATATPPGPDTPATTSAHMAPAHGPAEHQAEQNHERDSTVPDLGPGQFDKAIDRAEPTPPDDLTQDTAVAEPEPQPEPEDVAESTGPRLEPPGVAHWSTRLHGELTDDALRRLAEAEQRRATRLAAERDTAKADAARRAAELAADRGPHMAAVNANLEQLRSQSAAIAEADRLHTEWRGLTTRAMTAAADRARAERELDTLGRLAGRRRTDLAQNIETLRAAEERAQQQATQLAERAAAAQRQAGPPEARRRVVTQASAAEQNYPHARQAAQRNDHEATAATQRHADRTIQTQQQQAARLAAIQAEQHTREQLPEQHREVEELERASAPTPTHTSAIQHAPAPPEMDQTIEAQAAPEIEHAHEQLPSETLGPER